MSNLESLRDDLLFYPQTSITITMPKRNYENYGKPQVGESLIINIIKRNWLNSGVDFASACHPTEITQSKNILIQETDR